LVKILPKHPKTLNPHRGVEEAESEISLTPKVLAIGK